LESAPEQTGADKFNRALDRLLIADAIAQIAADLDIAEGTAPCRPFDSQCKKWGYTMMTLLAIRSAAGDEISDVPGEMGVMR